MIPSVLAQHVEQGVKDFLRTTFPITTPFFSRILEELLNAPGGVFKGPYLEIRLPFRKGRGMADYFPDIPMPFPPYLHQEKAFDRLSDPNPKSTIVATGTGSGKTECFLYPILDYCYRHRGEPGVKAILIYPMNALASDQAVRIAKLIHGCKLKGKVRAGIYVGQKEKNPLQAMTPGRLISDKETMRLAPPDILLTNYKMLDFLLIRPEDRPLWNGNKPESLRFLVVDELHTFDGAQGADLGCLIRRLKSRLSVEEGHLACVGTSATLGSSPITDNDAGMAELIDYASALFGEPFSQDSVITESVLSAGEFLGDSLIHYVDIPDAGKAEALDPAMYDNPEDYIHAQHSLWFHADITGLYHDHAWRARLSENLRGHLFFQNLLKSLKGSIKSYDAVLTRLAKVTRGLDAGDSIYRYNLLTSLLALISEAGTILPVNTEDGEKAIIRPFLNVRVQLWLRELRRMAASVSQTPSIRFSDDLTEEQLKKHLPMVHCRECGAMGWSGLKKAKEDDINGELKTFYNAFFSDDPKIVYLFPEPEKSVSEEAEAGFQAGKTAMHLFCPECLKLMDIRVKNNFDGKCGRCGREELIPVYMPDVRATRNDKPISLKHCPYCEARDSLTLLGSQAASLTSVMIVQLYSSTYNDDKKLLTFSDNVQDAAHRAGFFNSRTFRFNFRIALQKCVLDVGDGKPLSDLPLIFTNYWKSKTRQDQYIAAFLAPNMEWLADYDHLKQYGALPQGATLPAYIDKRIQWEIVSEYGFQARIGRTLEKTSSSVAYADPGQLEYAASSMLEILQNEIGYLKNLDKETLTRILLGIVIHLKNQGGIYQNELEEYIESYGNSFLINRKNWTPNFGPFSRTPSFITTKRGVRFDTLFSATTAGVTWYQRWVDKCLFAYTPIRLTGGNLHIVTETFLKTVFDHLVKHGVFYRKTTKGDDIWGILPEALRVSSRVRQFRCTSCSHNLSVSEDESAFFTGMPCHRYQCYGKYAPFQPKADYYGKLYASGDVERIFAKEHTGLLKRDERENLESEFKAEKSKRKPWYPNLLSCTPTLEMGIDIGDLSSLILCSVPPAQANYLQRIGRAGRRDGNALNLTVANARPHDLFFFAEPDQMFSGRVEPPGVFLDASAVLERQFTAFCFDNWIAKDDKAAYPADMKNVLNKLSPVDHTRFPHNLIYFIETHQVDFLDRFIELFRKSGAPLSQESQAHIRNFVKGGGDNLGSLQHRIMNGLHNRFNQRDSFRKKARILHTKIEQLKNAPKNKNFDDDLRDLSIEKSALQTLSNNIGKQKTLEFFTDEGLIPNYAFPEVGVMLNSLIYRKKRKVQEGERSYDISNFEYERPAASAIAELAPANTFYAEGRKVRIDQVDMALSNIESWRFCDNCSHRQRLEGEEEKKCCPRCGSAKWSDVGQKRLMLKMRQVFATTSDQKSRISDDSDVREPLFFVSQMLIEFNEDFILDAYKVDADFPFGFEFLSNVDFCEINFGEVSEKGEKVTIAGIETPRKGFSICRLCGKVQSKKSEPSHALTCNARDQQSKNELIDCIYLYRKFVSEAIRILLPVDIISESKKKLQSFIAAIQLGLKKKFKGKIDHLRTALHEEPFDESNLKRKYLVLYDTVPGGTGYLKQLMRSENQLMEVLELALETLKSCTCQNDPDKDGCYLCLFAYRTSYTMKETSRDTAIQLLGEILSYRKKLVQTKQISDISMNTFIESELEARFIGALKLFEVNGETVTLENVLVKGKPGYFLKIGNNPYYIEPQVELGELKGVSLPSKADFVISSARQAFKMKPVAVFLDGFTYHRNRTGHDTAQRMAIVQSGKYLVWSLSWQDVENTFRPRTGFYENFIDLSRLPSGKNLDRYFDVYKVIKFKGYEELNSFKLLVNYLAGPDVDAWRTYMFTIVLSLLDPKMNGDKDAVHHWVKALEKLLTHDMTEKLKELRGFGLTGDCFYGVLDHKNEAGHVVVSQYAVAEKTAVTPPGDCNGIRVVCCLHDDKENIGMAGYQSCWNGFLRLYNFYQFLPFIYFVTRSGIGQNIYEGLKLYEKKVFHAPAVQDGGSTSDDDWDSVIELCDERFHELIHTLKKNAWPVAEAGYELIGKQGEVIAGAELGWEELKIAFLTEEQMMGRGNFEKMGWKTEAMENVMGAPNNYMDMFVKETK